MSYTTLISTAELAANLSNPNWVVVDCRFALNNPPSGRRDYENAHIPGAVYAHLDDDLCSTIVPGQTGRHPLPEVDELAETLGGWGIDDTMQVVVYDDQAGGMAARLWWLPQWLCHEQVALLDGGWAKWQREGRPARSGSEARPARTFTAQPRPDMVADADAVLAMLNQPEYLIVDARAGERYRGDVEPIDPVAGHIQGAICAPYMENLGPDGTFLPPEKLRQRFQTILGETPSGNVVCYCGSGVTAAHNVLAIKYAGLGDVRLYPGSWSEWILDPTRPAATGSDAARTPNRGE